jgi:hypothetical protein
VSTIVIHGTLARNEAWWRDVAASDFLTALADGMAAGGRDRHDVWTIAGRPVSQFAELQPVAARGFFGTKQPPFNQIGGHFCWSGENVHRERLDGGLALARYLEVLAGISPDEPIDIVAHSHGANLVKVATCEAGRQVRFGQLVFLAAPHCGKAQVSWAEVNYYRLHASWANGGPPRVLNIYSAADPVQTRIAGGAPDSRGTPPGFPGWTPVFDAFRVEQDEQLQGVYEDMEVAAVARGVAEHGMLHNAAIGKLVGLWLARWPEWTGDDCRRHLHL